MRKVLVPVDGSDDALRALDFAISQIQSVPGSSVHLLTVRPPLRIYGEIQVYVDREKMLALAEEHGRDVLEHARAKVAGKVACDVEQLEGEPAETIVRRAAELGSDSIVMGTRGLGRVANIVLGSVAFKVVHLAAVPVTLVK